MALTGGVEVLREGVVITGELFTPPRVTGSELVTKTLERNYVGDIRVFLLFRYIYLRLLFLCL